MVKHIKAALEVAHETIWEIFGHGEIYYPLFNNQTNILKVGDKIKWDFKKDHPCELYAGKTYEAKIAMVDEDEKCYGVYAEYGQDLIPFDQATKTT